MTMLSRWRRRLYFLIVLVGSRCRNVIVVVGMVVDVAARIAYPVSLRSMLWLVHLALLFLVLLLFFFRGLSSVFIIAISPAAIVTTSTIGATVAGPTAGSAARSAAGTTITTATITTTTITTTTTTTTHTHS